MDLADELGGDPSSLLKALGISRRALMSSDQMLSQRAVSLLLERSAASFNCPDFGIRLAARQDISAAGPLAVVMRNCTTIGEAFRDVASYLNVFGSAPRVVVDQRAEANDIVVRTELWIQNQGIYPQSMELFVNALHRILQILSEGRAQAKAIYFQHAAISSRQTYRRAFLVPVTFAHSFAGLAISASDWARTIAGRDSEVYKIAHAYLDLQCNMQTTSLTSQVQRLVAALLASGKCRRTEVAEVLNLHPRTLIRRLAEENVSFEELVERERMALSERLLNQRNMQLSQIAALLGYGEQSSFTRSFRRWFGKSPSAARREMRTSTRGNAKALRGPVTGSH